MNIAGVAQYLKKLQTDIVDTIQRIDGKEFVHDSWHRHEGGDGLSCMLEEGHVFERAGVGYSNVSGQKLPPSASIAHPQVAGRLWDAMGVSLVLHPRNPYIPTVHLNVRFFIAHPKLANEQAIWWIGGGMDLTPYYPFVEDVVHFHRTCRDALDPFGNDLYPTFKRQCDEYFYIKHRAEARGVGGIFFDDFNQLGFSQSFALLRSVGDAFLPAYFPIVQHRRQLAFGARERDFQAYRRGRYVEFNLIYDRGTLFGLQSNGRTESILLSMPPQVKWRYNWQPIANSPESLLYKNFLPRKDWLAGD